MREAFQTTSFRKKTLAVIEQADEIITDYQRRGFTLTLRQLYYQFVSRDLLPNRQSEYKRLGSIVNDARLAGLLDWSAIEDRTRNVRWTSVWRNPAQIIDAVADQYRENLWADQPYVPEVWIEKDALVGVIERVCEEHGVPYLACRGYLSQSEAYDAGKRFRDIYSGGREPIILHLGDHDPSGLDMTRDMQERLSMFAGMHIEVRRLALNMDQIQQYDPPPNPAKDTDARFVGYEEEFGDESWELDALEPEVISDLVQSELDTIIDRPRWDAARERQEENRADLTAVSTYWSDVAQHARDLRDDDSD